jgi:hypothetical protein
VQVHFKCYEVQLWFLLLYLGILFNEEKRQSKEKLFFIYFSVLFLRKKLSWKHWLGIITVVAGLAVIGVSDIIFTKHPEGSHTNTEKIAGDVLILVGMLFTSCQV